MNVGFFGLLFIALLVLKLMGYIAISWLIILSVLFFPILFVCFVFLIPFIFIVAVVVFGTIGLAFSKILSAISNLKNKEK